MKKWMVIGLGTSTIIIWTAVIFLFLLSPGSIGKVSDHSFSISPSQSIKSIDKEQLTSRFRDVDDNHQRKTETIIGKQTISKTWADDLEEDGKLSIDTLLDSLDIEESGT